MERGQWFGDPRISVHRAGGGSQAAGRREGAQGFTGWVEEAAPAMKTEEGFAEIGAKQVRSACYTGSRMSFSKVKCLRCAVFITGAAVSSSCD